MDTLPYPASGGRGILRGNMGDLHTNSRAITGVVLGGGRGTRLYPLTAETSKQLLPVGDKPMIVHVIQQLLRANIKDILLLIDQRHASQFMQLLQDGSHLGANSLAYIWQHPDGKGLPSAIQQVAPHVAGDRLAVACGDVLIEQGIEQPVKDFMNQPSGARMVAMRVEDSAGYSPLVTEGSRVVDILPKDPDAHTPGLIDLGIYMYQPDVFERIDTLTPSARGETEIWDLNNTYAREAQLGFTALEGWWSDAGSSIPAYLAAHQHYEK